MLATLHLQAETERDRICQPVLAHPMIRITPALLRRLLPVGILAVLATAGLAILRNPPEMDRSGLPEGPRMLVETLAVVAADYPMRIQSYGAVAPRTRSMLVAQVGGQIQSIAPSFRPGGFFAAADILLNIDPRDYDADVQIAEAALMDAMQAEAQEAARAEQALFDWQRLGGGEPASELVLRRPQLEAARGRVTSARAALTKAQLDLQRTALRAPYNGRVLRQLVDVGQVVNSGAQLAEVYATDYVEIRLPLRNSDLPFIDLPEIGHSAQPAVTIRSDLGGDGHWEGLIVRTEGAIDERSSQLHVVAQIDDPFGLDGQRDARPLKIGQYVTAEIAGNVQRGSIVVPADAIYQNSYVYVVEEGLLQRREVRVAWQNDADALIASGLNAGDALVVTSLGQVYSGTPVRMAGQGEPRFRPSEGSAP